MSADKDKTVEEQRRVLEDELARQREIDADPADPEVRAAARDRARADADERLGVDNGGPNPS